MDTLKKILSGSVPLIASVIGTASPIAGVLFSAIAHMFGLNTDASADSVAAAIQADPDAAVKLKSLEVQHQDAILDAATQIRLGAYGREQSIVASTHKRDWVMDFLALFITISFVGLCLVIKFTHLDPSDKDLFYMLVGTFSSGFSAILMYYFGATNIRTKIPIDPIKKSTDVVLPPPAQTR